MSILTMSTSSAVDTVTDKPIQYGFNIKAQRADKAITQFARTANIPVLFPSEEVRGRFTNPLQGQYELGQAIDILLHQTGLTAHFDDSGQLIIKIHTEPGEEIMIENSKKRRFFAPIAAFVGALFATTAPVAQAQSDGSDRGSIEEVVVTAQFRAQSIQDVPISITALSSDELEAASIFDATSIAANVPGMSYGEFAPGQAIIAMRGIDSADDGAGLDNSVGLFLDGVYIGRGAGINFDMFDLERIEVLKGPQGTLFGRNSIGGAISVVTSKPTEEFSGKVAVTAGNEGILRYQGLVSGGLTDNLFGKFVVNHREHDGYVRNVLLNQDVQDEDQTSFRGQLLLKLSNSEWLLSTDYMDDDREHAGRFPIANGGPGAFDYVGFNTALGAAPLTHTTATPLEAKNKRETSGTSLQGDIEFDTGKLTTITAARNVEADWQMPSVGAPLGGGSDPANGVFGADVIDDILEDIDTFSQELRWTSNLDGKFNYVAGLYYFAEDTDRREQFRIDSNSTATGQVVVGNEFTRTENETTSFALYAQGTYEFTEQWALTAGLRYTEDERDYSADAINCAASDAEILAAGFSDLSGCTFDGNRVGNSLGIIAETFRVSTEGDWDDVSPMASLQFRPNDSVMYFATFSTGYKAGGFAGSQGVASAATREVDPEEVTNFELGFKGDFFDNSLRLNATAFVMEYEDLQVVRFGPVPGSTFGTFQTTNVGTADIAGLELDFIWQATDNFRISGNYGYLDTDTEDLVLESFAGPVDLSGTPLRQAPENTYNIVFNYSLPTNSGEYDFRLQFNHSDDKHFDFPTADETKVDDVDLVDLRIGWTSNSGQYNVALWGKNITEEEYVAHAYRIGPGSIAVQGAPRTVGVTATVEF